MSINLFIRSMEMLNYLKERIRENCNEKTIIYSIGEFNVVCWLRQCQCRGHKG